MSLLSFFFEFRVPRWTQEALDGVDRVVISKEIS